MRNKSGVTTDRKTTRKTANCQSDDSCILCGRTAADCGLTVVTVIVLFLRSLLLLDQEPSTQSFDAEFRRRRARIASQGGEFGNGEPHRFRTL
jgi:hypothetical protein